MSKEPTVGERKLKINKQKLKKPLQTQRDETGEWLDR